MSKRGWGVGLLSWCLLAACSRKPIVTREPEQVTRVAAADGKGESTKPIVGPSPSGAPVETAPPNVPAFKPAFAGQTRAPGVHTKTAFRVLEIASDLDQPWALAFLPDQRMLVTEKHAGRLLIVSPDGKKSPPVAGVPRVDGRNQGGLLDIELSPDYAKTQLVYFSYYEPREGGNGQAVARAKLIDGPSPKLDQLKIIYRMQPTL